MLTLVTSVGAVLWAYGSVSESEQKVAKVQADAEISKAQAEAEIAKAQNEVKIVKAEADVQIAKAQIEAQTKLAALQKKYQDEISKSNISVSNAIGEQSKNGSVYIQVPSDAVKSRIQNLTTNLQSGGYKAWIGVVGKSLSPNVSQIRYFHRDQEGRVKKLQEELIKINSEYKDFKLQYVPNFENKTRPDMMEVWFGKDSK
jgi:hypothetical protein